VEFGKDRIRLNRLAAGAARIEYAFIGDGDRERLRGRRAADIRGAWLALTGVSRLAARARRHDLFVVQIESQ